MRTLPISFTGDIKPTDIASIHRLIKAAFESTGNPFDDDVEEAFEDTLSQLRKTGKGIKNNEAILHCIYESLMAIGCHDEAHFIIYRIPMSAKGAQKNLLQVERLKPV